MKILIVASWFPDDDSPFSGVFIAEQARALARRHKVTVLAPATLAAGSPRYRTVEERDGYKLIRVGIPAKNLVHHFDYARAVVSEITESVCDVVHAHVALPAGFAAVLAATWSRRPVVITEHRGPFGALMESTRDRLKVRFALDRADEVIAVSRFLAGEMRAHGITRPISVVPNVVDTDRFALTHSMRQATDPFNLLFVGILRDHNKNLPLLLHALARLDSDDQRYVLTIVGEGEVRAECEELAIQLGISEKTRFRGAIDPSLLRNEMAACDVLVMPSRSETFGIVAAEALSVGRPVVATKCGGPEDIVSSETGLLVANDDVESLSAGIKDVCRNLKNYEAERLSEYAQDKFGFDAVVSQLTAIYDRVSRQGESARRAALLI